MPGKVKIADYIKFCVFLLITIIGFFTVYAILWVKFGLPVGWWATAIVFVLTALSEWGYISWLAN